MGATRTVQHEKPQAPAWITDQLSTVTISHTSQGHSQSSPLDIQGKIDGATREKDRSCQIPVNTGGWVRSKEQKLFVQKVVAQHGAFICHSGLQFKAVTTKIYGSEIKT